MTSNSTPVLTDWCVVCGNKVQVAIFKGTHYCSVDCRKMHNKDNSQQGTLVLLTAEEERIIKELRDAKS